MAEFAVPTELSCTELRVRDESAIFYTKSLLNEGDTMVIIKIPENTKTIDATGFDLKDKLIVHREKLIATKSATIVSQFTHPRQRQIKRRNGFQGGLPAGIQYVVELTPPEDGEEAVQHVSDTSVPRGMILWSTASARCGIKSELITGKDDHSVRKYTASAPDIPSSAKGLSKKVQNILDPGNETDTHASAKYSTSNTNAQILQETPDYCPIRYRSSVERFLQIVEGKEPRPLDSAPKVWTLAMVAKHLDCVHLVVDYICGWILANKNHLIMQILPEACLKLGMILRSAVITRASFAVLVSEEAIQAANEKNKVVGQRTKLTVFGRSRDDLDEDLLNMVQYAGRDFWTRIDTVVGGLFDPGMVWLEELPEYTKLTRFADHIENYQEPIAAVFENLKSLVENLREALQHYIRGRLFYCIIMEISSDQCKSADNHRRFESYLHPYNGNFKNLYNGLSAEEKVCTKYFWSSLKCLKWTRACRSNLLLDPLLKCHFYHDRNLAFAQMHRIKRIGMSDLEAMSYALNNTIMQIPPPQAPGESFAHDQMAHSPGPEELDNHMADIEDAAVRSQFATIDTSKEVNVGRRYFDLNAILQQIGSYLRSLCDDMQRMGENGNFTLPDTLMCLSDTEYKYLPLWAGGNEDGSGGVYSGITPIATAGPLGPGPAFHTGFSVDSAANSEINFDDEDSVFGDGRSTVGYSMVVGNGEVEHIDRRKVVSESEVGTEEFEDLAGEVEAMDINSGSAENISQDYSIYHRESGSEEFSGGTTTRAEIDIMPDDFFNNEGYEELDLEDDSSDEAKTEASSCVTGRV